MDLDFVQRLLGKTTTAASLAAPTRPQAPRLDAKDIKARVLDRGVNVFYDELSGQEGKRVSDTWLYRCWHHDDEHASLCIGAKHGGYECKGCGQTADLIGAWQHLRSVDFREALRQIAEWLGGSFHLPPPVFRNEKSDRKKRAEERIESRYEQIPQKYLDRIPYWQSRLEGNSSVLTKLREHYGVTLEAVRTFKLGWSSQEQRLMIPVSVAGRVVNVRKHDIMRANCAWRNEAGSVFKVGGFGRTEVWDVGTCRKVGKRGSKVTGISKHNKNNLYPSQSVENFAVTAIEDVGAPNPWICITGGELKAILLNSNGISAVTFTGGESSFVRGWLSKFKGLSVDIALDADQAGRKGAVKLADALYGVAGEVRIVRLPFGDVNDYYRSRNFDFSDWWSLPRDGHVTSPGDQEITNISFSQVHDVELAERPVQMHAVVAGGTSSAKFVISGCTVKCDFGVDNKIPNCSKCQLPSFGFERAVKVPPHEIITLSGNAPSRQEKRLRDDLLGIPPRCPHPEFEYTRSRVMPVLLAPDSEAKGIDWSDSRHFIFPVHYLGDDIPRDNEAVTVSGKICADPMNSQATMIATRIRPAKRSIHSATMSASTISFLEKNSENGTEAAVSGILRDMEFGVTRIYDQRTMLLAYLLLFFMPIRFKMFGGDNQKISPELLVVGDSRQGKTTAASLMIKHFGAGSMIDAEGASYVGLVGGKSDYGSAGKVFAWGSLPMQNGGLAFLDEIDELIETGIFGKLTGIRSSGVAQRSIAGGTRRTSAALRMIMATNPKGSRRLSQYDSLLYAIRELIKKPADLARFESVIGVYKLESPNFDHTPEPITYTQEIAQEHIRWAWTQKPDLSIEVSQAAADAGQRLAKMFKNLPTLEPTEARWKVGRFASAFAALSFSRKDDKVLVTMDHVKVAENYIKDLYSTPEWKIASAIGHGNIKSDDVKIALHALGGPAFARILINRGSVRRNDLLTAWQVTKDVQNKPSFEEVMATLTLYSDCLIERRGSFIKTDQFRRWLEATYQPEEAA